MPQLTRAIPASRTIHTDGSVGTTPNISGWILTPIKVIGMPRSTWVDVTKMSTYETATPSFFLATTSKPIPRYTQSMVSAIQIIVDPDEIAPPIVSSNTLQYPLASAIEIAAIVPVVANQNNRHTRKLTPSLLARAPLCSSTVLTALRGFDTSRTETTTTIVADSDPPNVARIHPSMDTTPDSQNLRSASWFLETS